VFLLIVTFLIFMVTFLSYQKMMGIFRKQNIIFPLNFYSQNLNIRQRDF